HRPQNEAPFQFWQYQHSLEVAGIADTATRQQRLDRGVLPFDVVETEAREAERKAREGGISLFALLRAQAAEAADAWQALGEILDVRAGSDAPPTSQVRDLL